MAFVYGLIEAGYPVTDAIIPATRSRASCPTTTRPRRYLRAMFADKRFDIATHGWNHTPQELLGNSLQKDFDLLRTASARSIGRPAMFPTSYIPPNDAFDDNTLDALAATGTPVFSAEKGNMRWFNGVDRHGISARLEHDEIREGLDWRHSVLHQRAGAGLFRNRQ